MIKKLIKHNKSLQKTIKTQTEMIDFLFKRLEDWNELVKEHRNYIDKLHHFNLKYLTICYILIGVNIVTISVSIIYFLAKGAS